MLELKDDVAKINRVGLAMARRLRNLGVATIADLLFYFPWRYDDFTKITPIAELQPGISANVVGQIELIQNRRAHRRRMYITEALIKDATDSLKIIWFNQPFITKNLKIGNHVSLCGKIDDDYGVPTMLSPTYEKIFGQQALHTQGLVPNYHLTANLTQKQLRFIISQIINSAGQMPDWLPLEIKKELRLLNLSGALKKIHFPTNQKDIDLARQRLAFDEVFLIQLESQLIKIQAAQMKARPIKFKEKETAEFVRSLPFTLTAAQKKAAWKILKDIDQDRPMSRLLEGDVGSGKTVVALLAMYNTVLNGHQAVLMAPTEILARQHYNTINKLLDGLKVKVGLITRSEKTMNNVSGIMHNEKKSTTEKKILDTKYIIHNTNIIIGTHALIQEKIKFNNLALAIIDEQHRFGVQQRASLLMRTGADLMPHLLSMTATPIPRSLALALYGDLDLSIIDELPRGRKKISTYVVPEEKRIKSYDFIRAQIKAGRQVFVICPLIDASDPLRLSASEASKSGAKSVAEEYEKLTKLIFPDLSVGQLHGRMKTEAKAEVMRDFLDNKIKILVSTSVVEVGVDVPNATIMMIEGAERFGLAQIHQFRGRVGRSEHQSYCFLFTDSQSEQTKKRLEALVNHNNGFELAKIDLKFRGPGEVYGLAQKGWPELKIASLFDYQLIQQARDQAIKLITKDPTLDSWPVLQKKLNEREINQHLE